MMGLGRIDRIAALLIERGWNVMTPAAVICGASTSSADVWTTSLRDLRQQRLRPERERGRAASIEKRRQDADDRAPATIVIGDVVRLGAVLGLGLDQADFERGREVGAQAEADEAAAGGQ
jgi:siroheme synthase